MVGTQVVAAVLAEGVEEHSKVGPALVGASVFLVLLVLLFLVTRFNPDR
jgi:hypothetical protein